MSKKNTKEQEHSLKIKDLKTTIAELEVKMESRSQEIISLSDILVSFFTLNKRVYSLSFC